ncbi:MAG: VTC domain-containing protein [Pseudomonadota bacterium]
MSFRIEEKIALTPSDMRTLQARLISAGMTRLHRPRRIRSVYFETAERALFLASEEGVLPRMKIRLRTYPETDERWALERKTSSIEGRFKSTRRLSEMKAGRYMKRGVMEPSVGFLTPLLTVEYRREYFRYRGERITFDDSLRYAPFESEKWVDDPWRVVEIKAQFGTSTDHLLGSGLNSAST